MTTTAATTTATTKTTITKRDALCFSISTRFFGCNAFPKQQKISYPMLEQQRQQQYQQKIIPSDGISVLPLNS